MRVKDLARLGDFTTDKQWQSHQMSDYMYTFPCSGHQNACPTANTHAPGTTHHERVLSYLIFYLLLRTAIIVGS